MYVRASIFVIAELTNCKLASVFFSSDQSNLMFIFPVVILAVF